MHFKKIEIFGFKSFANKTQLHFKSGVSAIVGPNGVGKSNIAEAIRWVLGEQSSRNLRASKMKDVIFNGTSLRKPLSLAEVSLTLSNSKKILPLDYEEVAIKRRILRSGENEYFLNKTPCRLKDISSLFSNTRMGSNAYSLIGQRDINLLVSSRPEEKRQIFEQAAGIGTYHQKKREVLKRLEQTESNLIRVDDIVNELQRQMSILSKEANKAKQYRKRLEGLKKMETAFFALEYRKIKQKSELINKEKKILVEQKGEMSRNLKQVREKFTNQNKQQHLLEEKLSRIYEQRSEIERLRERNNNQLFFNQQQIKEIEIEIKKIGFELEHIEKKLVQLNKHFEEKGVLIDELRRKKDLKKKEKEQNRLFLSGVGRDEQEKNGQKESLKSDNFRSILDAMLKEIDMIKQELNTALDIKPLKEKLNEYFCHLEKKIKYISLPLIKKQEMEGDAELFTLREKEKLETEMSQMLKHSLGEVQREKEQRIKQLKELGEKRNKSQKQAVQLTNEQKGFLSQKGNVEKEIILLRNERQVLSNFTHQHRKQEGEFEKNLLFSAEKIQKLEIGEQEFLLKAENIRQRMKERYNLDIEKVAPREIDAPKTREEMERVNRKLQDLGSVSLSSIEEEERLNERLSFLVEQKEDLTAAKSSIQKAIIKLDSQAKEMFIETLNKVEKEFSHFFNLLFLGGEAKIKREGEILNSDIHLIVHPPGKKLQDALLLSAGERALTAIALLFALFKVQPGPFCVLDEVDASLDESNVVRFINILKEFTQKTQFIIITHNKRTISIADIIYGVTMEERGISKLVSVNIEEDV